jgi:thioredoxin 1
MSSKVVTDSSFPADVLQSTKPVLVDYWAQWCGPCRMVSQVVDGYASEHSERLTVAKLNVDENPKTAANYHIRSIPTFMLFKGGAPVATHVGSLSKAQLAAFVGKHT